MKTEGLYNGVNQDNKRIIIFDTTLRDGEQSPGASLNVDEKLKIALQLERLGVDVIEAGFPIASPGDFEAVKNVSQEVKSSQVAGLARAGFPDIDRAWEALRHAAHPRIHLFIATSDIHLKHKLKKSKPEVLEMAAAATRHAASYTGNVEFSAEDATRSELSFLAEVVEAAIEAGAATINIPDTVGYAIPNEYGEFIRRLIEKVPNSDKAVFSVHCHNDLGLAVSNSLAAVANGVRQIECTINGLGERAGNAALEEVVMALHTRKDLYPFSCNIQTREIYRTSRMVRDLSGMMVQRNKAVVGENAFAHEAGVHQDGILKEKTTYEIMTPESIGLSHSRLVLGKHSGRHALADRLKTLGYELGEEDLNRTFTLFKKLADQKKEVFDEELISLVNDEVAQPIPEAYRLDYLHVSCGNRETPAATVKLKEMDDTVRKGESEGDGPVDAVYQAMNKIVNLGFQLLDYSVTARAEGRDAVGEVRARFLYDDGKVVLGKSASTDIVLASARAYIHAANYVLHNKSEK
ncbi:MAG: 2-isopropylmalate synthase [bacterium]